MTFSFKEIKLIILLRKNAEVQMEGQFLVRQIYDDELTYNLIYAAVEVLSKFSSFLVRLLIPRSKILRRIVSSSK